MQYSIYDLDLTGVNRNLDLRALLTQISDRAVVVIEDIDTVDLPARLPKVLACFPLHGLLGMCAQPDRHTAAKAVQHHWLWH